VDSVIRIILGVLCIGLVAYHFMDKRILPVYILISVLILIPFFLKTGITKICPIMNSLRENLARSKQHYLPFYYQGGFK
jgi:hypothetical protein